MASFKLEVTSYKRMLARLQRFEPDSPQMGQALFAIGTTVVNLAKRRATRERAVDSGLYRARIAFRIERSAGLASVVAGAFGIKYARMIEFGGVMTRRQMRAMFASFNERGKKRRAGKGIIVDGYYRGRPIMGRALDESRKPVLEILRKLVGGTA